MGGEEGKTGRWNRASQLELRLEKPHRKGEEAADKDLQDILEQVRKQRKEKADHEKKLWKEWERRAGPERKWEVDEFISDWKSAQEDWYIQASGTGMSRGRIEQLGVSCPSSSRVEACSVSTLVATWLVVSLAIRITSDRNATLSPPTGSGMDRRDRIL